LWRGDSRYSLLICLALPGLIWQNLTAFFHEGLFETLPALYLPLVLLAGCYLSRLTRFDHISRWVCRVVLVLAGVQSLAGLNPFYLAPKADGNGYHIKRTQSGENVTGYDASKRQVSWRTLADAVESLQREYGATLVIADSPETACALSFYLPRNPFVYVRDTPNHISQFDFWSGYDQSASPNDTALYVGHSTDPNVAADSPSKEIQSNFSEIVKVDDPPLPGLDKSWDFWNCERFTGGSEPAKESETNPIPERDALPK